MTVKTRANFKTGKNTSFADNVAGDISALDLRNEMEHIADSARFAEDFGTGDNLLLTAAERTAISTNTAKVSNATHTGDVTGSTNLTIAAGAVDVAMLSATGTPSSTTYFRGDNTWATIAGGGDVSKVGTPVNNQVGVWTGDGTIEGTASMTYDGATFSFVGGILLSERADHSATPSAGFAELWVSNDAVQKLYFTDDAGTDNEVALIGSALTAGVATVSDTFVFLDGSDSDNLKEESLDDLDTLFSATTKTLTNKTLTNPKATYTPSSEGTKSSGTYTPSTADGSMQVAVNGGAHTLAPQTDDSTIVIKYTNNGSAGTITTSGYTAVKGDAFTTTDTHVFICTSIVIDGTQVLTVQAMQ